jgi:hypothetical protein
VSIREIRAKKSFCPLSPLINLCAYYLPVKPKTIALIGICLLIVYALFRGWVNLGAWLAKEDEPKASEVIVCLSDIERIKKATNLYHKSLAPQIILTVDKEKKGLTGLDVPEARITLAPGPQTTYQEALPGPSN